MTLSAFLREAMELPRTAAAARELAAAVQTLSKGSPQPAPESIGGILAYAQERIRAAQAPLPPEPAAPLPAPPAFEDTTRLWLELADGIDRGLTDRMLKPERSLSLAFERLQKLLAAQGVERIESTGVVDDRIHNVVDMEQTTNKELHGQIAATVRAGYRRGGKLIRPEDVIAYEHVGSENTR